MWAARQEISSARISLCYLKCFERINGATAVKIERYCREVVHSKSTSMHGPSGLSDAKGKAKTYRALLRNAFPQSVEYAARPDAGTVTNITYKTAWVMLFILTFFFAVIQRPKRFSTNKCRGLSPPGKCALPGAPPKKTAAKGRCFFI